MEPLDRATIWPYDDGEPGELYYQRYAHPTGVAAERALGELEGGEALLFPSGTGAATALVLALAESRARRSRSPRAATSAPACSSRALERWGVRYVEFDQTGPPPDGVDLVWLEAPSNPFLTMPDLEAAAAHPGARRRRLDRRDARLPAPARARRRLRRCTARRSTSAATHDVLLGAVVCALERGRRAPARLPRPHRDRRRARPVLAAARAALKTLRGADGAPHRERDRARRAAARPPRGRARPLSGLRRPALVRRRRRRGRAPRRDRRSRKIKNATSLGGVESVLESRARAGRATACRPACCA